MQKTMKMSSVESEICLFKVLENTDIGKIAIIVCARKSYLTSVKVLLNLVLKSRIITLINLKIEYSELSINIKWQ